MTTETPSRKMDYGSVPTGVMYDDDDDEEEQGFAIVSDNEDELLNPLSGGLMKTRKFIDRNGLMATPLTRYSTTWKYSITGALLIVSIALSLFIFINRGLGSIPSEIHDVHYGIDVDAYRSNMTVSSYTIDVSIHTDGYEDLSLSSLYDLPWDTVAEMYKTQLATLTATYTTDDGQVVPVDNDMYTVKWSIFGNEYIGRNPNFIIDADVVGAPGVATCSVHVTRGDNIAFSQEFSMAAKYIRREIRSLTETDRAAFFKALRYLYTIKEDTGKERWGDKFQTMQYFLYKHLNGAGRTDCDHWHDGAGIVTHHMAFTLEAEQALQAIDPTIAMPYWEYSRVSLICRFSPCTFCSLIHVHSCCCLVPESCCGCGVVACLVQDGYDYINWWDSEIFGDNWFGQAVPTSVDHGMNKGHWSDLKFPDGTAYRDNWDLTTERSINPFVNPYGTMRAPWNKNPNPHLGRHNLTYGKSLMKMPSCDFIHGCFQSNSVEKLHDCLNDATHGPVHILLGGTWGEGEQFTSTKVVDFLQGPDKLIFFKNLWRMGFTRCPTTCINNNEEDTTTTTTSTTTCACAIPDEYLTQYGALHILQTSGIYDLIKNKLHDNSDETLTKVLRVLEDPGVAGDMFSSAASYDPSFWVVHGTLERILSLKRARMEITPQINFDSRWGFSTANTRYLMGICDWSAVTDTYTDLTLPTCNMDPTMICEGHNEDDVLEFSNFQNQAETYTNRQFFDFIHPWNDALPYVYDSYSFPHCEERGFTFV